jgi:hypothetical protein
VGQYQQGTTPMKGSVSQQKSGRQRGQGGEGSSGLILPGGVGTREGQHDSINCCGPGDRGQGKAGRPGKRLRQ